MADSTKTEYASSLESIRVTHNRELEFVKEELKALQGGSRIEQIEMLMLKQTEMSNEYAIARERIQKLETDLKYERDEKSALRQSVPDKRKSSRYVK